MIYKALSQRNHLKKFRLLAKLPHKWCVKMLHGQNGHMHVSSALNRSSATSRKNPRRPEVRQITQSYGEALNRKRKAVFGNAQTGFQLKIVKPKTDNDREANNLEIGKSSLKPTFSGETTLELLFRYHRIRETKGIEITNATVFLWSIQYNLQEIPTAKKKNRGSL